VKTVSVSVTIRIHDDGSADATHAPSTDTDVEVLSGMRFGGQDVVAAALMGEAVRRQANLMVGLVAATDPARMNLIRAGDVKETAAVAAQALRVLTEVAEHVAPSAVVGAVRDVTGAKDPTGG
jgi:hypothetical protein